MAYIITPSPVDRKNLYEKINQDKKSFMRNGDKEALRCIRLILGEINRDPKKDTTDSNIEKILKKVRKQTLKNPEIDYLLIELIDTYIEPPVSDQELMEWFKSTYSDDVIRFHGKSAFKFLGETKKHFNGREMNITIVKKYIEDIINE